MIEQKRVNSFGDFLEVDKKIQKIVGYSHYLYLELAEKEKRHGMAKTTQAVFRNGHIIDPDNQEILPDSMFIFNGKIKKFLAEKRKKLVWPYTNNVYIESIKKQTNGAKKMNIYELNRLISTIEEPNSPMHDMLDFYLNMKKNLMAELSKGVNEIIKNDLNKRK